LLLYAEDEAKQLCWFN